MIKSKFIDFKKNILFLVVFPFVLFSQTEKNIETQNLLWERYYNQLVFNEKWAAHTEIQNNLFLNNLNQQSFVTRFQARCKINSQIEAGFGGVYGFSVKNANQPTNSFRVPEYRIQADISWKQFSGKIAAGHRYLLENRYIRKSNNESLLTDTNTMWRFRYQFQIQYQFWEKQNQFLKIVAFDELMINLGKTVVMNTFDQNRIFLGLQYGISESLTLELGYFNIFQQRSNGFDYYDKNVVRFTILHKLKWK